MLLKCQAPNHPVGSPMIMLVTPILIACSLPGMVRVFTHITWLIFSSALRDRFHYDSHYTNKAQRGAGKCLGSQCWAVAEWRRDPGQTLKLTILPAILYGLPPTIPNGNSDTRVLCTLWGPSGLGAGDLLLIRG